MKTYIKCKRCGRRHFFNFKISMVSDFYFLGNDGKLCTVEPKRWRNIPSNPYLRKALKAVKCRKCWTDLCSPKEFLDWWEVKLVLLKVKKAGSSRAQP